jgi:beta-glucuronidase
MIAFMRGLDDSRLMTFVSLGGKVFSKVKPEENSFHYADILCPNIYGNGSLAKSMEVLHATWPDKPVFVTEFGWRADASPSEQWRSGQFREAMAILRKYPFVIGASVWSWNDYKSRHFGTNPDGYRHWGLVTAGREPRGAYWTLREEFSPVVIAGVRSTGNRRA